MAGNTTSVVRIPVKYDTKKAIKVAKPKVAKALTKLTNAHQEVSTRRTAAGGRTGSPNGSSANPSRGRAGTALRGFRCNFAPFAALLAPDVELRAIQRLEAATLRKMKGHFQLDNLLVFNRKFFPAWQPRFLVYERRRDLVRVGVAALAAEAYLPFQ